MLKTLGIVKGALLTEKQRRNLTRRLSGKSLLEWVVRQMTDSALLSGVVVLADRSEDSSLVGELTPIDVPVFRSEASDTLGCLVDVLENFPAESCLFIGTDWPFLDPTLLDQLIRAAESEPDCDYAAYQFMNDIFTAGRPFGLFPEWYGADALYRAQKRAEDQVHRNLPGCFFLDNQKQFNVELLPAPAGLDRLDIRLTCDIEDDWDNILAIHEALGAEVFDWHKLSNLLYHQPEMRRRMAALNSEAALVTADS